MSKSRFIKLGKVDVEVSRVEDGEIPKGPIGNNWFCPPEVCYIGWSVGEVLGKFYGMLHKLSLEGDVCVFFR